MIRGRNELAEVLELEKGREEDAGCDCDNDDASVVCVSPVADLMDEKCGAWGT